MCLEEHWKIVQRVDNLKINTLITKSSFLSCAN